MNIKIIVAAHKQYWMPKDPMYLPVFVGSKGKADIGYQRDDEGENISKKNRQYCELTGIYWAWKNLDADAYGLVHYRRYFGGKQNRYARKRTEKILSGSEAEQLLERYPILLTKKRRYYIETIYSHYAHTHYPEHLDITKAILQEQHPEYLSCFDQVMNRRSAHMFNMFIMKKEYFREYCEWIFPILEELDQKIDFDKYDAYQGRIQGRISEMLLDVWIMKHQLKYAELPVINLEKINWKRKILSFLKARIFGKKYDSSF